MLRIPRSSRVESRDTETSTDGGSSIGGECRVLTDRLTSPKTDDGMWFGSLNVCRALARLSSRLRLSWPEGSDPRRYRGGVTVGIDYSTTQFFPQLRVSNVAAEVAGGSQRTK